MEHVETNDECRGARVGSARNAVRVWLLARERSVRVECWSRTRDARPTPSVDNVKKRDDADLAFKQKSLNGTNQANAIKSWDSRVRTIGGGERWRSSKCSSLIDIAAHTFRTPRRITWNHEGSPNACTDDLDNSRRSRASSETVEMTTDEESRACSVCRRRLRSDVKFPFDFESPDAQCLGANRILKFCSTGESSDMTVSGKLRRSPESIAEAEISRFLAVCWTSPSGELDFHPKKSSLPWQEVFRTPPWLAMRCPTYIHRA